MAVSEEEMVLTVTDVSLIPEVGRCRVNWLMKSSNSGIEHN